ncbi:Hypothetical predicted protein [Pelobates cultripes]|uniref:Uncharacterized protein n=1 Tax=Pelobates cultripes TaxID=61616 RepID=A0AAD1SBL3_PELCU|nr:Hypothetical predicted protein [Pelobates cultripes]
MAPSSMSLGDRHRVSDTISKGLEATMAVVGGCPESIDEPQTLNGCHKRFSQCTSCSRPTACIMPTSTPCCSCSRRLWTSNCSIKPQEKLLCLSHQVEDDMGREWFQYARSFCENDTRHDAVPPNSPEAATVQAVTPKVTFSHPTSTQQKTQRGLEPFTPLSSINFERTGILHQDDSAQLSYCSGLQGPGLDSDFGVSAGQYMLLGPELGLESPCTSYLRTATIAPCPGSLEWSGITMTPTIFVGPDIEGTPDKITTSQYFAANSTGYNQQVASH